MALLPKSAPPKLEAHLETVKSRQKQLKKLQGWPSFGNFSSANDSMISQLVTSLDETTSLLDYYTVLKKCTQAIGNQLQEVYSRKAASKFFHQHLGKSAAMPCPDPQLNYFMRITFENVMKVYAERVSEELVLKKPKKFPLALLDAYLHEMRVLDQEVVEQSASDVMLKYLDQWGNNVWPAAMRSSDIVPRSWTLCVAKMKQIMALEWKPAPQVLVPGEDGQVRNVVDDSQTLESFVTHRAFFLALYLYCTIHPQFFAANFDALAAKTKESILGDFLVEWVQKRTEQLDKMKGENGSPRAVAGTSAALAGFEASTTALDEAVEKSSVSSPSSIE